jgi:hypothetical protein
MHADQKRMPSLYFGSVKASDSLVGAYVSAAISIITPIELICFNILS